MSNHLLVQLQRQHILLSYFKTLSVGPVWGSNPRPPAQQTGALPTELTRRRYWCYSIFFECQSGTLFLNHLSYVEQGTQKYVICSRFSILHVNTNLLQH